MKLALALVFALAGQAWALCENFSSYAPGTNMNSQPGWYSGGTGTWTADSGTFGMSGKQVSGGGTWYATEYRGAWTDIDYTVRMNNPYYVLIRMQNLGTPFNTGAYYIRFNSSTVLKYGKMCGGNNYDEAPDVAISVSLTDVLVRMTMVALVMNVYIDGVLVITHDFNTSPNYCGVQFNSGGIGFQYIGATTWVDNISVNETCISAPATNIPTSPYPWQRITNWVSPRQSWWLP